MIIGGGFGGLQAARALGHANLEVTLIDKRNFHLFQPLLYQVATGGLSPGDIASPLRGVLRRHKNTRVLLGEVRDVDLARRQVLLADRAVGYDFLVVASGSHHHYFGNDHYAPLAPGLKTVEDAIEIRRRIYAAFEEAEMCPAPERVQMLMTFLIVGGGPTGVELAGAVAEIACQTLKEDFRSIDSSRARIVLVESAARVLPGFPENLSDKALRSLRRLGVEVRLNATVSQLHQGRALIRSDSGEEEVAAATVLWAAGVKASWLGLALAAGDPARLDRSGRVIVQPDLTLPGHPEVFVIGDLAHFAHQTGHPLPGLAPVARQQGRYVARVIGRRISHPSLRPAPFRYRDRGNLATIGRAEAVGTVWRAHLSGWFAWVIWLFVHLMYLVEFENRLLVLMQWAWNYITRNRGARLITSGEWYEQRRDLGHQAPRTNRASS